MEPEVERVVVGLGVFFGLAAAGIRGVPFVGLAMAAIGIALGLEANRAVGYAEPLHVLRCDEACFQGPGREGWQFTTDAWQWSGLWIAALAGAAGLWVSVATAAVAGVVTRWAPVRAATRHMYVLSAVAMAGAVGAFGAFTLIVAPLGDRYGI